MVKINLGRDSLSQPPRNKKIVKDVPAEPQSDTKLNSKSIPLKAILLFVIFVALGGFYYYWLNGNLKRETVRNVTLTADKKKFEPYFELEYQYREHKETLGKKEEILTNLKKQQQLPVYFLQELGNSIPENVWLVKITSRATKLEIRAESTTEDAIYHFRDNLAAKTQWFKNVDYPGATRTNDRLEFTLTLDLTNSV